MIDFEKFVYLPRHALRYGTREFSLLRACSKIHVSGFSGMLLKAEKKKCPVGLRHAPKPGFSKNSAVPQYVRIYGIMNELVFGFCFSFYCIFMLHTSYRHTVHIGFVRQSSKTENGCVSEIGLFAK
jgi:hypothetical protein